jgi:hypothetical protein
MQPKFDKMITNTLHIDDSQMKFNKFIKSLRNTNKFIILYTKDDPSVALQTHQTLMFDPSFSGGGGRAGVGRSGRGGVARFHRRRRRSAGGRITCEKVQRGGWSFTRGRFVSSAR